MIRRIATALIVLGMVSPLAAQAQWAGPTQTPPGGTAISPINTGATAQVKSGGLSVGSLINNGGSYFSGNVGIGTTTPSQKLEVNSGNIRLSSSNPVYYTDIINNINGTNAFEIQQHGISILRSSGDGYAAITLGNSNSALVVSPQNSNAYFTGNVGIGTTNPQYKLDVQQTVNDTQARILSTTAGAWLALDSYSDGYQGLKLLSNTVAKWLIGESAGITDFAISRSSNGASNRFFTVTTAGNVGVATTSPLTALAVGGTITTTGGVRFADGTTQTTAATGSGTMGGSGTTNYIPKFTAASTLGNSLVFDNGTNVGIGNTAPDTKLHVTGAITAGSIGATNGSSILQAEYSPGSNDNPLVLGSQYSSAAWSMGYGIRPKSGVTGWISSIDNASWGRGVLEVDNGLRFLNAPAQATVVGSDITGLAERFRVDASGNVGIGTTNPGELLQVGDATENATNRKALKFGVGGYAAPGNFSTNSNGDKIIFYNGADFDGRFGISSAGDVWLKSLSTNTSSQTYGSINFYTGQGVSAVPVNRLSISGTGNIGIGTTAPGYKLEINGGLGFTQANPSITASSYLVVPNGMYITNGNLYTEQAIRARGGILDDVHANLSISGGTSGNTVISGYTFPNVLGRLAHAAGFMVGSYNSVGSNDAKTNPIYTIGSSYNPTDTALSNMYGIGFSHSNFWGAGKSSGWGLYQASAGTIYNTISDGGIWSGGTITSAGAMTAPAFYYSSDRNLKKNITPLANSLDKVTKLQGVSFDWKKDGKASVGLIAQDVEKVYPELVSTNKETGLKSVEYGNLVAPLIEAIKEQQKQIDVLKKEVEALKAR